MNDDDLESDLRRVLSDPSRRLPDSLVPLDVVYARASRRKARRSALAAASATAAAVLVVAGFGAWHVLGAQTGGQGQHVSSAAASLPGSSQLLATPTPDATSSPTRAASPSAGASSLTPVPAGFSPVSVTAVSPNHWWVLGSDGVVATTTDGGDSFSTVSKSLGVGARQLRFANAADGWAVTAGHAPSVTLWQTTDGGASWTAVRLDGDVLAVEAGGGYVFAVTHRAGGTWGVSAAPIGTGAWRSLGSLGALVQPPLLAVQSGHAVIAAWDSTGFRSWLVTPAGGPVSYPAPCTQATGADDLSATTGGVWLVCIDGTADSLWRSVDATSWSAVSVPGPASRLKVGAIAVDRAAVGRQDATITLVSASGASTPTQGSPGGGGWTYIAFTNRTDGFGLTDSGVLMRTTDGGHSWGPVAFS